MPAELGSSVQTHLTLIRRPNVLVPGCLVGIPGRGRSLPGIQTGHTTTGPIIGEGTRIGQWGTPGKEVAIFAMVAV